MRRELSFDPRLPRLQLIQDQNDGVLHLQLEEFPRGSTEYANVYIREGQIRQN